MIEEYNSTIFHSWKESFISLHVEFAGVAELDTGAG